MFDAYDLGVTARVNFVRCRIQFEAVSDMLIDVKSFTPCANVGPTRCRDEEYIINKCSRHHAISIFSVALMLFTWCKGGNLTIDCITCDMTTVFWLCAPPFCVT
jgi:hypothetical protein